MVWRDGSNLDFMIKYPKLRAELLGYLQALSDVDYQKNCWIDRQCPSGIKHDELDYAVHFLFDDTPLAKNPESSIGVILVDITEVNLIKDVTKSIENVFNIYGNGLSDEEYINKPEWACVLRSASVALSQLNH